jgi:hypothetical protein
VPTLNDVLAGSLAQAVQVQQIIDALKGTPNKGVPVALVSLNDPSNYALTVQNDDPTNSRALSVLKADGTTLISADANGVTLGSPVNLPVGSITSGAIADGTIATADLANQAVTNAKLGTDTARLNLLTNGGFEIWQRGNGPFTTNGAYAADRWQVIVAAGDTVSASRDTTNKSVASTAAMAVTATHGAGGTAVIDQVIKLSDEPLQGKTITLSVAVKCSTANAIRVQLSPNGTGGAPVNSGFHTGDGTFQTLTATAAIPADATQIDVAAVFAASATAYLDNAMVVVGSQPADYAPLHPADDLARCLRYYEQPLGPPNGSAVFYLYGPAGGVVGIPVVYHVPKAVTPTITKIGSWAVANSSQPAILASSADMVTIVANPLALGTAQFGTNAAGAGLTVESNP